MEKNNKPLVSVLMTCFNRQAYLAEAIESVLALRYENYELIIVDDCSFDGSFNIASQYAKKDSRIKLYRNEKKLGDYANRNKAASLASGKYLKYLDSDDLIFPWALDVMVECMEKFPAAAIGVSQNLSLNIIYPKCIFPEKVYRLYYYRNLLLSVGPTATIIRHDIFSRVNGFREVKYIGDTELWLRVAQKNPIVLLPPGLVYWREHHGQQIFEERKNWAIEKVRQMINEQFLTDKNCPLSERESMLILRNLKNIKCRRIIQNCLNREFKYALERKQHLQLGIMDFLIALKKNKVPHQTLLEI
jgi:glycosyltransferase involved in cell wall biosynthesis